MGIRDQLASYWAEPQHRNAFFLMANTLTGAAAGLLFWLLFTRALGLPAAQVGIGYTIVAIGTTVAVIAKGGFDTAIVRNVPDASRRDGLRLLGLSILLSTAAAVALTGLIGSGAVLGDLLPDIAPAAWLLVAAMGIVLIVTWLQDAYFLAEGDARPSFERNVVLSAGRLLLPFPVVLLGLAYPIALTWTLALAASALAAFLFVRRIPKHDGHRVPRRTFLKSSARNISGTAAEFLPGLLLAPLVLAVAGAEPAAYFGIAWTAASLLFLASAAMSRSAMAAMVRNGVAGHADAIRRITYQHLWTVLPAAIVGVLLAPYLLGIFGAEYAAQGATVFMILCASILVVAPAYAYLAVLRARERPVALIVFPAAMIAALFLIAPYFIDRFGLPGVAIAWFAANAPFGAWGAWKLRHLAREVTPDDPTKSVRRAAHVE